MDSKDSREFHEELFGVEDNLIEFINSGEKRYVIMEKGRRGVKMGRSEKKRLAKRKSIEKKAERREDIRAYGGSLEG
jgi:hypothetical protein